MTRDIRDSPSLGGFNSKGLSCRLTDDDGGGRIKRICRHSYAPYQKKHKSNGKGDPFHYDYGAKCDDDQEEDSKRNKRTLEDLEYKGENEGDGF